MASLEGTRYRWEEDNSPFILSGALVPKRIPETYVHDSTELNVKHRLAEGQLRFGSPEEYKRLKKDEEFINECIKAGSEYREPNLQQGVAFVRKRFKINSDPYVVFSEGGSDRILKQITSLFSTSGTTSVLYAPPCFPNFINYAKFTQERDARRELVRIAPIPTPLGLEADSAIEQLINMRYQGKLPRNKVFYLCIPTTPTGEVVSPDLKERVVNFCAKTGNTLIIDEAFGDVLPDDESAIKYTQDFPNLIVTRSLSKVMGMPGERIGYAVMSKNEGEKFEDLRKSEAYDISGPKQVLINRIMDPDILVPHAKKNAAKALEIKSQLLKQFDEENITYLPTDPRVPILTIKGEDENFYNAVLQEGVDAVDGRAFHSTHPEMTSQYIRISIPAEIEECQDIARRISTAYFSGKVMNASKPMLL